MSFTRTLKQSILAASEAFPVVLLTGARQVGKTTLLEMCAAEPAAPARAWVSLDDLDARELARRDPALFLQTWPPPVVIDEIQYAPELFSAIKLWVDRSRAKGLFWLTGSQKFELMRGVTESLAGRVAVLDLAGLSQAEIARRATAVRPFVPTSEWVEAAAHHAAPLSLSALYERIWLGSYPQLNVQGRQIRDLFYRSYVQTYVLRDVRDVLRLSDHTAFNRFMAAVAARTSQLINFSSLARDVDIDNKTAKAWMSVLEASGLVYIVRPWHSNLSKRLIKAPKLYFLDTGLVAYLTRWPTPESLEAGALSGAILETWVVSEILKSFWHNGLEPPVHFYRDDDQREIDLLIESADTLYPVEIKKTAHPSLNASRQFGALVRLGRPVGPGAVICLAARHVPLSAEVTAVPVSYL